MDGMGELGLSGFIAAVITELVNRGLGLKGRTAFAAFLVIAGLIFAVKVGADYSEQLRHAWDWLLDFLSAVAAGTGAHRVWGGQSKEKPWDSTTSPSSDS